MKHLVSFNFRKIFFLLFLSVWSTGNLILKSEPEGSPLAGSRQVIVVITDSWDAVPGEISYFERSMLGDEWKLVIQPVSISVGRNGLGWGNGLHGTNIDSGPIKKEGDGKAPAGVFKISAVFGYAREDTIPAFKMPYIYLNSSIQCIDDVNSVYYNLVVDSLLVKNVDWKSYEQMKRNDHLYRWGAVIEHNSFPRIAGGGSCIFLHIWKEPGIGTSGCTAFDESKLLELLKWLDHKLNPVLVQLPRAQYKQWKKFWQLPRN